MDQNFLIHLVYLDKDQQHDFYKFLQFVEIYQNLFFCSLLGNLF